MENRNSAIVTTKEWMITMLLMIIPIVNIVLLFMWAFGTNAQASKSNWAKATLIWFAIGIVLNFIFYGVFGAKMISMLQ